jgi:hypothetical protein
MNYQLKIDIKKLNKAFIYPIQGKTEKIECICIPVTEFFKGKPDKDGKEPYYCTFEIKEKKSVGQYGDTHFAVQNLEKESYKALSEEQKKNLPILGNLQPSKFGNIETVDAVEVKSNNTESLPMDEVPF